MQKKVRAALAKLRSEDSAIFRALLDELPAAVDALRCDVMDAVILQGMLHEVTEVAARGDMPLARVARVRVLVRLMSATIVKIEEKARALADACDGGR